MHTVKGSPLLIVAPIEPCTTGNGLAMRVGSLVQGASTTWDVTVVVVPGAGTVNAPLVEGAVSFVRVLSPEPSVFRRRLAALLADPFWRRLLSDCDPMPLPARVASPVLAADVVGASRVPMGTPVHAVRSYLAPLGFAVADALRSPWSSLDLDDDDVGFAEAQGDSCAASSYRRLVSSFASRFTAVSLSSPTEALDVARRHNLSTMAVPNAIAIPASTAPRRRLRSGVLLFVGNFNYPPNVEAAVSLVKEVLPALQARMDRRIQVVIVGDHPPYGPIADLASNPAVTVTGFVADLDAYYSQAEVVVAPLRNGSGTRIKLLEAFARGVPVVTTPVGCAGLAVRHMRELLTGRTVDEIAAATALLLDDPSLGQGLAKAAGDFVRLQHASSVVGEKWCEFLDWASQMRGLNKAVLH
jgi:glycosyltransferase involved in cell wall biosynthesis